MPLPGHRQIPSSALQFGWFVFPFSFAPWWKLPLPFCPHFTLQPSAPWRRWGARRRDCSCLPSPWKQSGVRAGVPQWFFPALPASSPQPSWSLSAYPGDTIMFKVLFCCCFKYNYTKGNLKGFLLQGRGEREIEQELCLSQL